MEPPKSQTAFDPTRTPFTSPAARFTYLELENPLLSEPKRGKKVLVKINSNTLVVETIDQKQYPDVPHALPPELMAVDQPNIRTCGVPQGRNKGCYAAVNGGCPILQRYGRIGRVNIIIEKDGKVDSAPCDSVYCGITEGGRPTSQVHYLLDQWNILTDRTVIPENVLVEGAETVRYTEVPHLAPFYEEAKVGRFAEPAKKLGRPKGSRNRAPKGGNREDRPSASV
jgi:hypothetical protein